MSKNIEELNEDPQSQRVGQMLQNWLEREDWNTQEVADWLQGYNLPPVGYDDEPFVWILRGILFIDERYKAEKELAQRLAVLLKGKPDLTRPGARPEEVLYNLFMLSAGLSLPDELAEPLYEVFMRRELTGEWLGIDLRVALQAALISNQIDRRLYPVWQSMLEGGHDFLPGKEDDALDGIAMMPPSKHNRDEPALDEIGSALKSVSISIQCEHDRRSEFYSRIQQIVNTYPGRASWHQELVWLADKNQWPDWAVVSLPNLCVPLGHRKEKKKFSYLIWDVFLPFINETGYGYDIEKRLCNNKVSLVHIPEGAANILDPIADILERRRLEIPLPSYSAVLGAITDSISEIMVIISARDVRQIGINSYQELLTSIEELQENTEVTKPPEDILEEAHKDILPLNRVGMATASSK